MRFVFLCLFSIACGDGVPSQPCAGVALLSQGQACIISGNAEPSEVEHVLDIAISKFVERHTEYTVEQTYSELRKRPIAISFLDTVEGIQGAEYRGVWQWWEHTILLRNEECIANTALVHETMHALQSVFNIKPETDWHDDTLIFENGKGSTYWSNYLSSENKGNTEACAAYCPDVFGDYGAVVEDNCLWYIYYELYCIFDDSCPEGMFP